MRRDRLADDIYTFTSDLYAQVTAGVILTSEGAIVIDTLPFPQETEEMVAFIRRHQASSARYVILTHHHSDHTNGAYLFPEAELIAHPACRVALGKWGERNLAQAKRETPGLTEVQIRLPNLLAERECYVHLGTRSLRIMPLPGHTNNDVGVFVEGDKILFAGDALLPVPHFVWGGPQDLARSLRAIRAMRPESVVQGHGQLLLRGELSDEIDSSLRYIECVQEKVTRLVQRGAPEASLEEIDVEVCGRSRVPLDGLVQYLHQENLRTLYARLRGAEVETGSVV